MKRFTGHLVLAAFLAATWLGMYSCDRLDESLPVASSETVVQDDISIAAPEALASIVEDGTITSELKHRRPGSDANMRGLAIFHCLELTAEQKAAIAAVMNGQRDCTKSIMDSLRASEQPLVEAARTAQKAVRDQLKAGTITRAEALAQLAQIKADLQAQLESNPVREWARQALEACRQELYKQIRSLLTAEQQAIWDEWVATGTLPCDLKPRDDRPARDTTRGGHGHGPHDDHGHGPHDGDRPTPPDSTKG